MTMAEDSPPPLRPQAIDHVQAFEKLQIVKVTRFAPDWLRDARSETMLLEDIDSRRREIVFAVCFIESYLFEWVRDDVLCRNYPEIEQYFDHRNVKGQPIRLGITERWKTVMKKLSEAKKISASMPLDKPAWQEFQLLVRYRDGLVHGVASRPEKDDLPADARPIPTVEQLQSIPAGWPTQVAINLVIQLHKFHSTTPPSDLGISVS
jgi:hypothetical protein